MPINVWDYLREYDELRDEILATVDRVFRSGRLVLGQEGVKFEREMASYLGVAGGVGVNSGTDAIYIALASLGIKAGDEVITVPNTAVPTVSAIRTLGATPVFVDIRDDDFLMDVGQIEAAITPRTKAIIPVHIYGHPADMDAIVAVARRHGVPVLEDACQAHGALYKGRPAGSLGQAACFSFYPSKNLGAYGEAGALVTNDPELAEKARILRDHGSEAKYQHSVIGINGRMEAIQAAVLGVKLPHLQAWNARRRKLAQRYDALLAGIPNCRPIGQEATVESAYHLYVVRVPRRDVVRAALADRGVGTQIHYPIPVHRQPAYAKTFSSVPDLPVTDEITAEILSLPLYPELEEERLGMVASALAEVLTVTG